MNRAEVSHLGRRIEQSGCRVTDEVIHQGIRTLAKRDPTFPRHSDLPAHLREGAWGAGKLLQRIANSSREYSV